MNIKRNSDNASNIRGKSLLRIAFCCAFIATAMLTGCVKEGLEQQLNKEGLVSLQIKAAISNAVESNTVETKAPITGTNFPVSDAGTVSNIGLFMMQSDGTTPYAEGSDNMTAELTGKTGPIYTCRYQYNGGEWMESLGFYINETIKLWGYYPRNESATVTAIPFDLTTASEQDNQTDILWSAPQTVTATSADYKESVSLSFKHAYALLEFKIKKKIEDPATFTRVDVMNKSGKSWIVNKGSIDPQTGVCSGTAGTVSVNCSAPLATDSYTTIRVMVPAFSGDYADDDIEVQFAGDNLVIEKFLIKKSYLTEQSGNYGFTAGATYSFKLLYNNFAEGSLTLLPWNTTDQDEEMGHFVSLDKVTDATDNVIVEGGGSLEETGTTLKVVCNTNIGGWYTVTRDINDNVVHTSSTTASVSSATSQTVEVKIPALEVSITKQNYTVSICMESVGPVKSLNFIQVEDIGFIPNSVLIAAGWPDDKLPTTGLQIAKRGNKVQPDGVAEDSDPGKQWRRSKTYTGGTVEGLGMGKSNTAAMAGAEYPAAEYCRQMGEGWFLPSMDELSLIYKNKSMLGNSYTFKAYDVPNTNPQYSPSHFWSSTELNAQYSVLVNFYNGSRPAGSKDVVSYSARCVKYI